MQTLQKILPKYSIGLALVFVITMVYLFTRGNTIAVEAAKVTTAELVQAVYATGYVEAEHAATLNAELSGRVRSVGALEGERVRKGQEIIVFDSRQQGFSADEVRALIAEEEAFAKDNALKLSRSRILYRDGAISRQQFDEAERNSAQSQQKLLQRQQQLKIREDELKKIVVTAPFDGILTRMSVKTGDNVSAGTMVATVTDTSDYIVAVEVDELDVPRLRTGLSALIAFDAMPEKRFNATVVRIVPQTDRVTKTSKIYLHFDRPVPSVQSGMTATANIIYKTRPGALLVRKSSVFDENRRSYVWKIEKGRLKKQLLKTGDSDLTYVEVLGGLADGDLVVLTPEEKYREGMETRLVPGGKKAM